MKTTHYCVLWMPCTIHSEMELRKIEKEQTILNYSDDEAENQEDNLLVTISHEDNHNFNIIVTDGNKNDIGYSFELTLIEYSRNGLYLYKYDYDDESPLFNDKHKFPPAIYHKIKEFYHEHENNDKSADGNLIPFVSDTRPKIKKKNNKALLHYLEQYENIFFSYYELANSLFNKIQAITNIKSYYNEATPNIQEIRKLYLNAIGEKTYYNCLYYSVYNQTFTLNNRAKKEHSRKIRQKAFNISNTIERIKLIHDKANLDYQQHVTEKSLKSSIRGVIIGIAGLIIGIAGTTFGLISILY